MRGVYHGCEQPCIFVGLLVKQQILTCDADLNCLNVCHVPSEGDTTVTSDDDRISSGGRSMFRYFLWEG